MFVPLLTVIFLHFFKNYYKRKRDKTKVYVYDLRAVRISVPADLSHLQAKFARHSGRTLLLHAVPLNRRVDAGRLDAPCVRDFRFTRDWP